MSTITVSHARRLVKDLDTFVDATAKFCREHRTQPGPTAQATQERSSFPRPESVRTACSQGAILVEVAADHLMTFVKSVTEPVQTIAPWSCVRAVLETSAIGAWILDPSIDAGARVGRSFAFRYEGLDQELKYSRLSGNASDFDKVSKRIDAVERDALKLGYPKITNRKKDRIGIGQNMPSVTDIIRDMLDKEKEYRLLSAMTHGHLWAVQQAGFRKVEGTRPSPTGPSTTWNTSSLLEKCIGPDSIASLTLTAVTAFTKPLWYMCQFFGWNTKQVEGMLDENYDRLGIRVDLRIWRP